MFGGPSLKDITVRVLLSYVINSPRAEAEFFSFLFLRLLGVVNV